MKISSINSYNYASFGVRKKGKYSAQNTNPRQEDNSTKKVLMTGGVIGLAAATALGVATIVPGPSTGVAETEPNSAYVENAETKPYQDIINETIDSSSSHLSDKKKIEVLPQSEREAVWYEVKKGDRLADIVKEYAELHELTPDAELVPYYEILEQDNPGKWQDRNNIWIGIRFRVDGIMPKNRVVSNEETQATESTEPYISQTEPTEESQITTEKDKVQINGNIFTFDADTMDKTFFGDYEGLMFGKFASINVKMNGGMVLKKFEGVTDKTNLSQKMTYDEDGKIIEMIDYKDDKAVRVSSYAYKMDSMVETVKDKTAKGNQIDEVITDYSHDEDFINSRQFIVNGKTIADFNFINKSVRIGEFVWNLEKFESNDDVIGSKRYTGVFNGQPVRFDVLKNGFCVEYIDANGQIEVREQFDSNGEMIFTE